MNTNIILQSLQSRIKLRSNHLARLEGIFRSVKYSNGSVYTQLGLQPKVQLLKADYDVLQEERNNQIMDKRTYALLLDRQRLLLNLSKAGIEI